MSNTILYDIVIDTLVFLESSTDSEIDPDIAVAFSEDIVGQLQEADSSIKNELSQRWRQRIAGCDGTVDNKYRLLLQQLMDGSGIWS